MNRPTVRGDLALMEGYHSAQVDVSVRLNTNESPFPPPPAFVARLGAAINDVAWHRYPDRAAATLRAGIAALHGLDVGQVFAANGSNEVLQTVLLTYGGAGRTVLTCEPTYALHAHIARLTGADVVTLKRDADFAIGTEELCAAIVAHRPAVVFLCSPNNPTGLLEPRETIEAAAEAVADIGGLLVVDEAYGQFAPWSAQSILGEDRALVVTRTYSKTWSMAAARLGYLLGPSWLVAELDKVVLPYHLSVLTQTAGILALDYAQDMEQRVAAIVEQRDNIEASLAQLAVQTWPSSANFVLFRPLERDGEDVWNQLVKRSVLVRNCASWPGLAGCLRVTVGTAAENDAFLSALSEVLGS